MEYVNGTRLLNATLHRPSRLIGACGSARSQSTFGPCSSGTVSAVRKAYGPNELLLGCPGAFGTTCRFHRMRLGLLHRRLRTHDVIVTLRCCTPNEPLPSSGR